MKNNRFAAFAFIGALMLGACVMAPPAPDVPDLTFAQVQPVPLDVSRIEFVDQYRPPMQLPNVEHTFKTPLLDAVHQLVIKQIVPQGADRILRVVITDASVKQKNLPVHDGIVGAFSKEAAAEYDGNVVIRFEIVDQNAPDIVIARASVNASRGTSTENNISPADRDMAFFKLTEALMNDISAGIAGTVRETLGKKY